MYILPMFALLCVDISMRPRVEGVFKTPKNVREPRRTAGVGRGMNKISIVGVHVSSQMIPGREWNYLLQTHYLPHVFSEREQVGE